jgi:hypothetical protein
MAHYDKENEEIERQHYNQVRSMLVIQMKGMSKEELDFLQKVVNNIDDFMKLHQFLKNMLSQ